MTREEPASVGQRLLWLLERYRGQSGALNCPLVCRIRGPATADTVAGALGELTARHESLRTTFGGRGRSLTQVIHEPRPVVLDEIDLSGSPGAVEREVAAELRTGVDATAWPARARLWRVAPEERVLCLAMHHLVTDLWSCAVLQRELGLLLEGSLGGGPGPGPPGWQYAQFARWQEELFAGEEFERHREYWHRQLAGAEALRLPMAPARADATGRRRSEHAHIDAGVAGRLRDMAARGRTTQFAVMLAVFYALLREVTGQDDLRVASLFANRSRPEVRDTVGFLTNLLVLRCRVPRRAEFTGLVESAHATVMGAHRHQAVPYHVLRLAPERADALPAHDVVFQMAAEPIDRRQTLRGVEVQGVVPDVVGRFDFELALMPSDDGFVVKLYYTEERLPADVACRLVRRYCELAAAAA